MACASFEELLLDYADLLASERDAVPEFHLQVHGPDATPVPAARHDWPHIYAGDWTSPQNHLPVRLAASGGHTDRGLTPGDGVLEVWATREFRYGGEHTVLRPRARKDAGRIR